MGCTAGTHPEQVAEGFAWIRDHPDRKKLMESLCCFHGVPASMLSREDLLMVVGLLLNGDARVTRIEEDQGEEEIPIGPDPPQAA